MASRAELPFPSAEAMRLAKQLAAQASLEMGGLDACELADARAHLVPGQKVFVSHLPRQTWSRTFEVCRMLAGAGFDPVPHIPARLLADAADADRVFGAAHDAGVLEPLLIAGDYAQPRGGITCVLDVLRTGVLRTHGFERVSFAGHPEGHPQVSWDVICQAQVDKWRAASAAGLRVAFVTQFGFLAAPFIEWARFLRSAGVEAELSIGLAGPTSLGRLIRLAAHCGVGASLRRLTARPASALQLLADQRPDALIVQLAMEKLRQPDLFDGIHLFSLGGFLRTASWLRQFTGRPIV